MQQIFPDQFYIHDCIPNQNNKEERRKLPVDISAMPDCSVQDGTSSQTGRNCDCCSHRK